MLSAGAIAEMQAAAGGGGGGGVTHRYFEIISLNAENLVEVRELEMAASSGGADLCSGGTASAVTINAFAAGPSTPSQAFDDNAATPSGEPNTGVAFGTGWRYDFGSAVTVSHVRITAHSTPARAPDCFFVRGSDDASTWTTYLVHLHANFTSAGEVQEYALGAAYPTSGRSNAIAWRILVTANNGGGFLEIQDLIFAPVASGAGFNALGSGTPGAGTTAAAFGSKIGSGGWSDANFEKGMNGSTGDRWYNSWSSGNFLGAVSSSPVDIEEVRAYSQPSVNTPNTFDIQYTTDFNAWTTAKSESGITGWTSAYKTFSVP